MRVTVLISAICLIALPFVNSMRCIFDKDCRLTTCHGRQTPYCHEGECHCHHAHECHDVSDCRCSGNKVPSCDGHHCHCNIDSCNNDNDCWLTTCQGGQTPYCHERECHCHHAHECHDASDCRCAGNEVPSCDSNHCHCDPL
ncbi:uncharacterized protein LOC111137289 [Crassostrea virginica]